MTFGKRLPDYIQTKQGEIKQVVSQFHKKDGTLDRVRTNVGEYVDANNISFGWIFKARKVLILK